MRKQLFTILALLALVITTTNAQWNSVGAFPDTTVKGQAHGLAVDPDGKIWAAAWDNINHVVAPGDTVKKVRVIHVFNADGSKASFSPIWVINLPTEKDTLFDETCRGMRTNIDGNILIATGGPSLFLVDYKTGKGLKKVKLTSAPTAPCVADNGTIFIAPVSPGVFPVSMYDQNLTLIGSAVEKAPGYSRSFEVAKDGNTIYWAGYDKGKVYVYNRASEFDAFALKDSIMIGAKSETFTWHPTTKYLWMGGGSYNDLPIAGSGFTPGTWYAYDFATKKVVDSLKWTFKVAKSASERPRALAFSPDGKTAYIGAFGGTGYSLVQKLVNGTVDVADETKLPEGYSLSQNYPNPFNPSTQISYTIPEQGFVTLKVYNSLGQEIATLVNAAKNAGTHNVSFNAANLASGMYFYTMTSGDVRITKKMMLIK